MVLFNYATKELTAKVVYYGPGLCGKTTNLQWIHEHLPIKNKGKMLSLATETDRTLFFDFLPIDLGQVRGMKMRLQLYTVPGQVFYNATRRMVLKGADAVVFVVDSQEAMFDASLESFENMRQNLEANEIDPDEIPTIFQYNKRDLANALPIEILNERLNPRGLSFAEAVAIKGAGVEDTLKLVTRVVFATLSQRYGDGASAPLSLPAPLGPGGTNPPGSAARPAPRTSEAEQARPTPKPPTEASPPRPVAPRAEAKDELFDSLDLSPLDEQLPALDIEEEDTSPALTPKVAPLPPSPAGARETLAVAPSKAAEIRQWISSGRIPDEELSVDLSIDADVGAREDPEDMALEDFGTLLSSTDQPVLTPEPGLSMPPTFLVPQAARVVEPKREPESEKDAPSPRAQVADHPATASKGSLSPSSTAPPSMEGPSATRTPAFVTRVDGTGETPIVIAQAQISVPVEVQVPPGCNRINLALQLVIRLKEKR